jgi:acetyl-CoA C-acetyltransferase
MASLAPDPRTPVLVGVGQASDRTSPPDAAGSPLDLMARAAAAALADCGGSGIALDTVAVVRLFADSGAAFASPFGAWANLPRSLARRLGATPRAELYGPVGGNTPQMLVNLMAERIAQGHADAVLIAGGEALRTQAGAVRAGVALDWGDDVDGDPETLAETPLVSGHEVAHGIALPVNVYPLFDSALAARLGGTPAEHIARIGALMAPFTTIAAANPHAALPVARTAEELTTPTAANRMIASPYTKYLVSNLFVDQAAAVVMLSTAAADAAGVPHHRRVYLHGCADSHEPILVSARSDYAASPSIRLGAAEALAMAGIGVGDLAAIDLYSCFPVAVAIAAREIGLADDDPRGLTLTGGLPYFGGAGNNYSMHAVAEAVARARTAPGSYGFVFANGGYLTKSSFGVYATTPTRGRWTRADPAVLQREIDAIPSPAFTRTPAGPATVEALTVVHDRGLPAFAIVIGRQADGTRFLARSTERLAELAAGGAVGRRFTVVAGTPVNRAAFA